MGQEGQAGQARGGLAGDVRERCDAGGLTVSEDVVGSLGVRMRGMENKADVVVGVSCRSPSRDASTAQFLWGHLEKSLER